MAEMTTPPVRLTLLRHPFSTSREVVETPFTPKVSLLMLAESHGMADGHVLALVGDVAVPRAMWEHISPKPGVEIILRRVPEGGGGGKNPLASILSIASFFVPLSWGPAVAGMTGVGWYGVLAKGALTLAGMALSRSGNQRLSSPIASAREASTFQLTGGSNKVAPYGVVPRLYGRHRIFPPFAAVPYTETVGGKQYLNCLFDFGTGPLAFEDFRIGGTPLANYTGVQMEVRPGHADDAAMTLFRNDVSPQSFSVLIKTATGPRVFETAINCDEATLGFVFQNGLVSVDAESGMKLSRTLRIHVDYRVAGSGGSWLTAGVLGTSDQVASTAATLITTTASGKVWRTDNKTAGKIDTTVTLAPGEKVRVSTRIYGDTTWTQQVAIAAPATAEEPQVTAVSLLCTPNKQMEVYVFQAPDSAVGVPPTVGALSYFYNIYGYFDYTASQAAPVLVNARIVFPARDKYEVRVIRWDADTNSDYIHDEITWQALNSITYTPPVNVTGHALVALRILATEQLNGVVQEFSAICTSLLPVWDGAAWTSPQETSNPAWVYADILSGSAAARPVDKARLDTAALEEWADDCDALGLEFNGIFDFRTTVFEAAHDVASVGRASFHMRDGLYSVVQDKAQTTPVQHFTPRNSWGFEGSRRFVDMPHAVKCRFLNKEKDWQQDERLVCDDGYTADTATTFEVMELFGVDNPDQAWKAGRFHIACARLRSEEISFYADVEHIVCNRGDLILVSHDVPLFGLGSGRLKSVTLNGSSEATAATLDAEIVMDEGKDYSLRMRLADGSSTVASIVTVAGGQTAVTFQAPIPAVDSPAAGDLFLFGETGRESVELRVVSVEPREDLSAHIRCVDAAPAVYTADQGAIPPWESHISLPSTWSRQPARPTIESVVSDESVLILTPDGGYQSVIQVVISMPSESVVPAAFIEVGWRISGVDAWSVLVLPASMPAVAVLPDVVAGQVYDVRVRAMGAAGETGDYTETTHTVVGATTPPPAVTNLLVRNGALIWSHAQPRDHAGYKVRYHSGTSIDWSTAAPAHTGIVTSNPWQMDSLGAGGGTVTFLVKAVDLAGNESDAAALTINLGDALTDNIILQRDYHPDFAGTISDGAVVSGELKADDDGGLFWGSPAAAFWGSPAADFWVVGYVQMTYETSLTPTFEEAGGGRVLLDYAITGNGFSIDYRIAGSTAAFWGPASASFWGASGDAFWASTPDWLAWPGELTPISAARVDFRVTTAGGIQRGTVSSFSALLDVPDVIEYIDDAAIASAGTRLVLTKTYRAINNVNLTLQDIGSGARFAVVMDKSLDGPLIQPYDGNNAAVAASVDATIQGY